MPDGALPWKPPWRGSRESEWSLGWVCAPESPQHPPQLPPGLERSPGKVPGPRPWAHSPVPLLLWQLSSQNVTPVTTAQHFSSVFLLAHPLECEVHVGDLPTPQSWWWEGWGRGGGATAARRWGSRSGGKKEPGWGAVGCQEWPEGRLWSSNQRCLAGRGRFTPRKNPHFPPEQTPDLLWTLSASSPLRNPCLLELPAQAGQTAWASRLGS